MTERPLVQLIIASTRPGRAGEPTARWFAEQAMATGAFDVEIVDLSVIDLPMLSEPQNPRSRNYAQETTREFSRIIDRAAGYILVFPEYNHGYNAALKNALDHLYWEWVGKPVALVSYGGVAAGARAAVALQTVLLALRMRIAGLVQIPFIDQFLHAEGDRRVFQPNEQVEQGAKNVLEGLSAALRPAS